MSRIVRQLEGAKVENQFKVFIIIIISSSSSPEGGGSTGPGSEARSQTPGLDLDQGAEPALTKNIPLLRARRELDE